MKLSGTKLVLLSALCFCGAAASAVFTDLSAETSASEKPVEKAPEKAPEESTFASAQGEDATSCVTGAAVDDLNRQRERLEAREKELQAKEAELKAAEAGLKEELKKIEEARAEFGRMEDLKKKENEEKVAKIVETVETMSPKPAAVLVAALDDALAVTAMQRISTPKLAKIMNIMEPGRSSRLTELLAGVVRARGAAGNAGRNPASHGAEGSQTRSVRGGEKNDGQNEQSISGGKERDSSRRAEISSTGKVAN